MNKLVMTITVRQQEGGFVAEYRTGPNNSGCGAIAPSINAAVASALGIPMRKGAVR